MYATVEATAETGLLAQAAAVQGYGEVQRMQAPQPDMWEAQPAPAAQPAQRAPPQQPPQPPGDDFVGGAPQSFFGEMPPRGAVGPSFPEP